MFEAFKEFCSRIFSFGGDVAVAIEADDLEAQAIVDDGSNATTHAAPTVGLGDVEEEPRTRSWHSRDLRTDAERDYHEAMKTAVPSDAFVREIAGLPATDAAKPVENAVKASTKPKRVKRATDKVYPAKPKPAAKASRKKATPKKTTRKKAAPKK